MPRSFYLNPTLQVARDLLGKLIIRNLQGKSLIGRIVEVEAYRGSIDPASHAYRGKTKRNEVMFFEGGHLYVYFTYGMHFCANVVTQEEGVGEAVLIRAVEPVVGLEKMKENRGLKGMCWTKELLTNLTSGPARFCQAFGIKRAENGTDLLGSTIFIIDGNPIPLQRVGCSNRIGVRNGTEKKWRFFMKENPWVSRR